MAELAVHEVQLNHSLGGAPGLLGCLRLVPQESVDFRIGAEIGEPILVPGSQWTEKESRGLEIDAVFPPPGFDVQASYPPVCSDAAFDSTGTLVSGCNGGRRWCQSVASW